jgi:hypothetical protein
MVKVAKVKRAVGGYIWNQEISRLRRTFREQRKIIDTITQAIQTKPISAMVLLTCGLQLSQTVTTGLEILNELEQISGAEKLEATDEEQ